MTLNTALIIAGDASGALAAASDTSKSIQTVGAAAQTASGAIAGQTAAVQGSASAHGNLSTQAMSATHAVRGMVEQIALGVSPLQAMLGQMNHLSFAASGEGGLVGAFKGVGATIGSILTPMNLAVVGAIALGTIGVQALGALIPKAESATEALARHRKELDDILAGYGDAQKVADSYFDSLSARPRAAVLSDLQKQFDDATEASQKFQSYAKLEGTPGADDFSFMTDDMKQLIAQFNAGKLSASDLYSKLTELRNTDLGPLSFAIRPFIDGLADSALKVRDLGNAIVNFDQIAAGMSKESNSQFALDQNVAGSKSAASYDVQLAAINARSPAQLAEIARKQKSLDLDGQAMTAARQQQEIDQAGAIAYAQAAHTIATADTERLRAANQNIAASQLDLTTIGQSIGATQQAKFAQQQLATAAAAAAQSGTTVTKAYRDEVEKLAADYGKLQQSIAVGKLTDDLSFARDQLGRSSIDQQVASTLRPIYGNDLSSAQAQFLGQQIRVNQSLSDMKDEAEDIARGALGDLKTDLLNGVSIWGAFADAGANALDKIADKAFDVASDNIISGIFGAITGGFSLGGSSGGGVGGAIAGIVGGAVGHNATGTSDWRGGLTAANENGGEIFNLPNGTQVIPHDVSMEMAKGGGAAPLFQVVNNSRVSVREQRSQDASGRLVVQAIIDDYLPTSLANAHRRGRTK